MKRNNYIFYYLQDPTTGDIGYVGMTTESLSKRLRRHIQEALKREHSPESDKNKWVREVYGKSVRPLINEIETAEFPDALQAGEREKYWIAKYREDGYNITNMTDGGLGTPGLVLEVTEATKEKIAESLTTDEWKDLNEAVAMRKSGASWKTIYEHMKMSRTNFYKLYKDKIEQQCQ